MILSDADLLITVNSSATAKHTTQIFLIQNITQTALVESFGDFLNFPLKLHLPDPISALSSKFLQ